MKGTRLFSVVFSFAVISSWLQAQTSVPIARKTQPPETVHISLNGPWKLFYFPQGTHHITNPDQLKSQGLTPVEATVPGDAPLDLSRQRVLPADLFFGENLKKNGGTSVSSRHPLASKDDGSSFAFMGWTAWPPTG